MPRPLGEVVEVLALLSTVYLELNQGGTIRREDDVEQPSPVRADLRTDGV